MNSSDGFDRPIDDYPRVRDTGRFVIRNGVVPLLCGFYFVYRAWAGHEPGLSALMAQLCGMLFVAAWASKRLAGGSDE